MNIQDLQIIKEEVLYDGFSYLSETEATSIDKIKQYLQLHNINAIFSNNYIYRDEIIRSDCIANKIHHYIDSMVYHLGFNEIVCELDRDKVNSSMGEILELLETKLCGLI